MHRFPIGVQVIITHPDYEGKIGTIIEHLKDRVYKIKLSAVSVDVGEIWLADLYDIFFEIF